MTQQRAELNHLKAELLLAREDLAAERASRLKLQAAIASQAHAEASRARQEHMQQAAAVPLLPESSFAVGGSLASSPDAPPAPSVMVVGSGSTSFWRPAAAPQVHCAAVRQCRPLTSKCMAFSCINPQRLPALNLGFRQWQRGGWHLEAFTM